MLVALASGCCTCLGMVTRLDLQEVLRTHQSMAFRSLVSQIRGTCMMAFCRSRRLDSILYHWGTCGCADELKTEQHRPTLAGVAMYIPYQL